jgi:hypothetical protein
MESRFRCYLQLLIGDCFHEQFAIAREEEELTALASTGPREITNDMLVVLHTECLVDVNGGISKLQPPEHLRAV